MGFNYILLVVEDVTMWLFCGGFGTIKLLPKRWWRASEGMKLDFYGLFLFFSGKEVRISWI